MHYYQFNIADYQSHTRHLSLIEDICYRRMLDWVYLHEKPLPSDIKQVARILLLNDCLTDVERVLNEFFTLAEQGWVNVRAMSEISDYNDKQEKASRAGKASAEARKNKIKQQLNNARQHTFNERSTTVQPNIKQETLNNNHKPNHHQTISDLETERDDSHFSDQLPNAGQEAQLCAALRPLGVQITPANPLVIAWVTDSITLPQLLEAVSRARLAKPPPNPIPAKYLDTTVRGMLADAAKPKPPPQAREPTWYMSKQGIDSKGRELGMFARGSETYDDFKQRIFDRLRQDNERQNQRA